MNQQVAPNQKRHLANLEKIDPRLYRKVKQQLRIENQPRTRLEAHNLIMRLIRDLTVH